MPHVFKNIEYSLPVYAFEVASICSVSDARKFFLRHGEASEDECSEISFRNQDVPKFPFFGTWNVPKFSLRNRKVRNFTSEHERYKNFILKRDVQESFFHVLERDLCIDVPKFFRFGTQMFRDFTSEHDVETFLATPHDA